MAVMAVHAHAAAQHSSYWYSIISLRYYLLSATYTQAYKKNSRHKLLDIGSMPVNCIFNQEDPRHDILMELVRSPECFLGAT